MGTVLGQGLREHRGPPRSLTARGLRTSDHGVPLPLLPIPHPSHVGFWPPHARPPAESAGWLTWPHPRLGRTLTCEEGQEAESIMLNLARGIPPPLEEGREDVKARRWLIGNKARVWSRQRGGQGCRGDSRHSLRLPHGLCPGHSACAAPQAVPRAAARLAGETAQGCLQHHTTPGPSLLPVPQDLPLAVLGHNPHTTLLTGQPQFSLPQMG